MGTIFNKRNAFVGWLVVKNKKRVVKEAAHAVPVPDAKTGGIVAGALAGVAAFAGGLLFWRKKHGGATE
jgi:hypothetical protein